MSKVKYNTRLGNLSLTKFKAWIVKNHKDDLDKAETIHKGLVAKLKAKSEAAKAAKK